MIAVAEDEALDERAVAARAAADQARARLDDLTAQLLSAVSAEDFGQAAELKALIADARGHAGRVEAEARALEAVLKEFAAEERTQAAQVDAEARRARAQRGLEQAYAAEREGLDELQRVRAEIEAGLDAVRASMLTGIALEQAVYKARSDTDAALIALGERQPGTVTVSPNTVSAWVNSSPALIAVLDGRALPGAR